MCHLSVLIITDTKTLYRKATVQNQNEWIINAYHPKRVVIQSREIWTLYRTELIFAPNAFCAQSQFDRWFVLVRLLVAPRGLKDLSVICPLACLTNSIYCCGSSQSSFPNITINKQMVWKKLIKEFMWCGIIFREGRYLPAGEINVLRFENV